MSDEAPMRRRERGFLILAALLVLLLQVFAIRHQSLIGDAPYHLLAGEQAWRSGTNAINLEHPPLVKLIAALPLLGEKPVAATTSVDGVIDASLKIYDDPDRARRARIRARGALLVAVALPLIVACFLLGRRFGGPRTGAALALMIGLSFPILPHLVVVQTDAAVALGFTLTVLALLDRRPLFVGGAFGLASASKFSAVLLLPVVVFGMLLGDSPPRRKVRDLVLVGLTALCVLEASYALANFRYDSEIGRDAIQRYCRGEALITGDAMRPLEKPLLALERFDPRLAQYLTGLFGIRAQNDLGVYPTYAFGEIDSEGRWWFFPALLLTILPIPVLIALIFGFCAWTAMRFPTMQFPARFLGMNAQATAQRRPPSGAFLLPTVAAGIYLAVAIVSSYNLGIRHLLPILPLLLLPAAWWTGRDSRRAIGIVALLAIEAVLLTPRWMSATNTWWLGEANPTRTAFSTGQSEYRQNFLLLHDELQRRRVESVGVLYPLLDERELRTWIPSAHSVRPGDELGSGWYAVSVLLDQYLDAIENSEAEDVHGHAALVALTRQWRPLHEALGEGEDHGSIAGTFRLVRIP